MLSPALLTVLSEGFRWFSGVKSSAVDCFWRSKAANSLFLFPEVTVSPESGGGDSALGNSVVTVAAFVRFA
jgi:hypothetical protein